MALVEGASWAPLPNDDIATIPIFLAPFSKDELITAFAATINIDGGWNQPCLYKFRPRTVGGAEYGQSSLWWQEMERTDIRDWFRDAVQQTLGGVNSVNLNLEWSGKSDTNISANWDSSPVPRAFIFNPQGKKVSIRRGAYGPSNASHKLPVEAHIADGAWYRNDLSKWTSWGYDRGPDWYDAGCDMRITRLAFPESYMSLTPNELTERLNGIYLPYYVYNYQAPTRFNYAFDMPEYWSYAVRGAGVQNYGSVIAQYELDQFGLGMGLVSKLTDFDPSKWGALATNSSRNWNYFWGLRNESAVDDYDSNMRTRTPSFYVHRWSGFYYMKHSGYLSIVADDHSRIENSVMFPHLHIRSSDGYWMTYAISISADPKQNYQLCAVTAKLIRDPYTKFVGWNPFDNACKGLRVARFSPRAGTNTVGLYEMSKADIVNLNKDLYHTDLGEWANQLFAGDGAQGLLGLRFFWGVRNKIAYRASNAKITIGANTMPNSPTLKTVNNEIVEMNMGSIDVPPVFGDHRDITVVDYKLWIPFVGMVDLNPHDVVGQKVALTYYINLVDGSAIAQVINCNNCLDGVIFAQACDWGVEIPIRADARADAVMSAAMIVGKTVGGIAGGAIGGVPGAIAGGIVGAVGGVTQGNGLGISYSVGNLTPSANMLTDFRPKLIVYKPDDLQDEGYSAVVGVPTAKTFEVGSVTGFLSAQAVQNTNVLPARYADEIVAALQSGVYLS